MRWRLYGLGLLWCSVAWPCVAEEITVIREATTIPPGQSRHFEFGTVAQAAIRPCCWKSPPGCTPKGRRARITC